MVTTIYSKLVWAVVISHHSTKIPEDMYNFSLAYEKSYIFKTIDIIHVRASSIGLG
jgi:hypothetical protein